MRRAETNLHKQSTTEQRPVAERESKPTRPAAGMLSDWIPSFSEAKKLLHILGLGGLLVDVDIALASPTDELERKKAQLESAFVQPIPTAERAQLVAEIGEQRVQGFEQTIAQFPVHQVVQELSVVCHVPVDQIYSQLDLQLIFPYSPASLEVVSGTANDSMTEMSAGNRQRLVQAMEGAAGIDLNDVALGLNLASFARLSEIYVTIRPEVAGGPTHAEEADKLYRATIFTTLLHEFVHAADEMQKSGSINEMQLYEGLVDSIASSVHGWLVQKNNPLAEQSRDISMRYPLLSGYGGGEKAAARLFLFQLDSTLLYQDVLQGNWRGVEAKFDKVYGPGAWQEFKNFSLPSVGSPGADSDIAHVMPLYTLLRIMQQATPEQWISVVANVNNIFSQAPILPILFEGGTVAGVLLPDEDHIALVNAFALVPSPKGAVIFSGHDSSYIIPGSLPQAVQPISQTSSLTSMYPNLPVYYNGRLPMVGLAKGMTHTALVESAMQHISLTMGAL